MRVFILGTGRCGSVTFINACRHITNYTAGHETRSRIIGPDRIKYDDFHIEADNRLAWFLGSLEKEYGDGAVYVHLVRDRDQTAKSFMKRFDRRGSIVAAFCEGIKMTLPEKTGKNDRLMLCYDYIDTVTTNIEQFLADKSRKMTVRLEQLEPDFKDFWNLIGAEGDLESALGVVNEKHNVSEKGIRINLKYVFVLPILRIWKRITIR